MNGESRNKGTVTVNNDQTQTSCPIEVQAILEEFSNVFPKDLPAGLPPQCELDHRIELTRGVEPPYMAPYKMSP